MSASTVADNRKTRFERLLLLLFVVSAPFALSNGPEIFDDGDVSWHIATGRWILAHGIPSTDPFSHTMPGHPWVAHEWVPDIVLGLAYNLSAYGGVAAVVAVALFSLLAIIGAALWRRVGAIPLIIGFLAMLIVLQPFLLARPHVLVWPVVAGWTAMLLHYRDAGRAPPMPWALLMTLWTNMHGSFPLGLAIAGAIALDALIAQGWRRDLLVRWFAFGLASTAAALLNANGLPGLTYPFATMGMDSLPMIEEWKASNPADTPWFFVALGTVVLLLLFRRAKLRPGEILLLLFLVAMALSQVRHQTWLAIVGMLVLMPRLAKPPEGTQPSISRPALAGGVAATVLALVAARLLFPAAPAENAFSPRAALANLSPRLKTQPVFNEYSFGGPLILAGIRPFVDGRADMYGDAFMRDYHAALNRGGPDFERAVQRHHVRWTMLPTGSPLSKQLDRNPAWRRVYADGVAVVHERMD